MSGIVHAREPGMERPLCGANHTSGEIIIAWSNPKAILRQNKVNCRLCVGLMTEWQRKFLAHPSTITTKENTDMPNNTPSREEWLDNLEPGSRVWLDSVMIKPDARIEGIILTPRQPSGKYGSTFGVVYAVDDRPKTASVVGESRIHEHEVDRSTTHKAFKFVKPSGLSSHDFYWPIPREAYQAPPVVTETGNINRGNTAGAPSHVGDGITVAKTIAAATCGGNWLKNSVGLWVEYDDNHVLGQSPNGAVVRVSECRVVGSFIPATAFHGLGRTDTEAWRNLWENQIKGYKSEAE